MSERQSLLQSLQIGFEGTNLFGFPLRIRNEQWVTASGLSRIGNQEVTRIDGKQILESLNEPILSICLFNKLLIVQTLSQVVTIVVETLFVVHDQIVDEDDEEVYFVDEEGSNLLVLED